MRCGLFANTRKDLFWEMLSELLDWFEQKAIPLTLAQTLVDHPSFGSDRANVAVLPDEELCRESDMLLSFGGDGTILRTMKLVGDAETPVLGVNVGGLGFLTGVPLEGFTDEFERIYHGEYSIEKRLMLHGQIAGHGHPLFALNEILIDKGSAVRVIQIEIEVEGRLLNSYVADGLLISTPTGSTAYSLACGGPICSPATNVLIINPINPHSLTNRPVIVPAGVVMDITVKTEAPKFVIAADGDDVRLCPTRTRMRVRAAAHQACLVKPKDSNYYELLHAKLNWGEDFRNKQRWSHDS